MIGASFGKSNTRAVFVHARNPLPISASLDCVNTRMIEVLPLCTLPSSHTTGANWRARSAMGVGVLAGLLIGCPWMDCRVVLDCNAQTHREAPSVSQPLM